MNNRRSFFKSLALLGAAAGCPGLFIPKFEPVRWKLERKTILWTRAEFRYYIYPQPALYDQVILHLREDGQPVEVGTLGFNTAVNSLAQNPDLGEWEFQTCDSSILSKCV